MKRSLIKFCGSQRSWGWLLIFWALVALPAMAQPTNVPALSLEEVSRAMAKVRTVFTRFVQERHLSLFNEPLRSEGCLCFEKPGRVRWEISSPYKSILLSDGSGVAQFEWMDEKWKKLDAGLAGAMQSVIAQIAAVMEGRYASDSREYTVTLAASPEGPVITLVPRNATMRKMMQAIEVRLAADLRGTRGIILRETGGDFTDIRFSEQVVDLALPARTFDQKSPLALADILQAAAKSKAPR